MKIALTSLKIVNNDVLYNLSAMENCLKEAKSNGACLVCLGESFKSFIE